MEIASVCAPALRLLDPLTARERDIIEWVVTGATNKEIAYHLGISTKTVKNTLTGIYAKTGTASRTQLAVRIVRMRVFLRGEPQGPFG